MAVSRSTQAEEAGHEVIYDALKLPQAVIRPTAGGGLPISERERMAAYEAAGESDDWYTPKYIFDALGETFDMDVAAPEGGPRHVPTHGWYSEKSLESQWFGFVWMNPPFGHQTTKKLWLRKFFDHSSGIALVPDRTSAPWFQEYAPKADAILWVSPKIKFERPDGTLGESPGTGTALLAAGQRAVRALERSKLGFVSVPKVLSLVNSLTVNLNDGERE